MPTPGAASVRNNKINCNFTNTTRRYDAQLDSGKFESPDVPLAAVSGDFHLAAENVHTETDYSALIVAATSSIIAHILALRTLAEQFNYQFICIYISNSV